MSNDKHFNRRDFFADSFKSLFKTVAGVVNEAVEEKVPVVTKRTIIRPPGALDELEFLSTCQRCGTCGEACLSGAILYANEDRGIAVGTPYMNLREKPCDLCMKCTQVCPSGALKPIPVEEVNMGTAMMNKHFCNAHQGQVCDYCYDRCPLKDEAIKMVDGKPEVVQEKCVGCGICEYYCVVEPTAIKVWPFLPKNK